MKYILLAGLFALLLNLTSHADEMCDYRLEVRSWKDDIEPAQNEIQEAYHRGYHIRSLKAKYEKIQKSQTPEDLAQLPFVIKQFEAADKALTEVNDRFVVRLHKVYTELGIPAKVVDEDGSKVLVMDFSKPIPGKTSSIFSRVQERYGLTRTTISLKENAVMSAGGFYSSHTRRMELGPMQGMRLLDDYFMTIGKHESRHAMFQSYRDGGIESVYHISFHGSKLKKLNGKQFYDRFMSAEELYTHSTDLQKIAVALKGDELTEGILSQMQGKAEGLKTLTTSILGVNREMSLSVDHIIKNVNEAINLSVEKLPNGNLVLEVFDKYERSIQVNFVSDAEKALLGPHVEQSMKFFQLQTNFITETLEKKGMKDVLERFPGQLTEADAKLLNSFLPEFLDGKEAQLVLKEMIESARPAMKEVKERLELLSKLSTLQAADVNKLLELIKKAKKNPAPEIFEEIKDLVSVVEKRVKEGYKGFAE